MPKRVRVFRLLLASPSDTTKETKVVEAAINDVNRLHGHENGYRIELLHWLTDAYPAVGADGQDVLNRQMGDYDILLLLMSTRYGSPTGRSDSGTVEEFDRSWSRSVMQPDSIQIMVYFRDPLVRLSAIDGYDLLQIQRFQKLVRELGVYHGTYDDPSELAIHLRNHLPKVARDILSSKFEKRKIRKSTREVETIELLPDWHARQNVFPQWSDRLAVPLERYASNAYSLTGTLYSESPYFRFGFRLFPREGKEWGDGMIPSRESENLVMHVGKNVESPYLFVTSYLTASRLAPNIDILNYEPPRPVSVELAVNTDFICFLKVDGKEVLKTHINPTLAERLNIVAWGDEHEFEVDFTDIKLKIQGEDE